MRATINGVKIGYDDFGSGPAVLFVHDYPLNRQMWQQQVEPLVSNGFRVVLTDLRGYGDSELNTDPVNIQTYSDDLIGLLDYLGIGRAAACGLALGGYVLFDLMERYPQRIAGACLVSSRPVVDDIHERAKRGMMRAELSQGRVEQVKLQLYEMLFADQAEGIPEPLGSQVRGWIQQLKSRTLDAAIQAIAQRKDYTFLLKSLRIPTLLVGAEQDPITHPHHTDIMANQLPNCCGAVKLNSGHLVNLELADEFNNHLLEFLFNLLPRRRQQLADPLQNAI